MSSRRDEAEQRRQQRIKRLRDENFHDPFPKGVERIFKHFGKIWAFTFVLGLILSIALIALIIAGIAALV
jgi:hypothetical protein